MYYVLFVLVALVAGWLAGQIMKGRGFGFIGNMVLGMFGGLLGGIIYVLLFLLGLRSSGLIALLIFFVAAVVGSVILLLLIGLIKKK